MKGEGGIGEVELFGNLSNRHAVWPGDHEQSKDRQPRFLGESGKRLNGGFYFHIFNIMETSMPRQELFDGCGCDCFVTTPGSAIFSVKFSSSHRARRFSILSRQHLFHY